MYHVRCYYRGKVNGSRFESMVLIESQSFSNEREAKEALEAHKKYNVADYDRIALLKDDPDIAGNLINVSIWNK